MELIIEDISCKNCAYSIYKWRKDYLTCTYWTKRIRITIDCKSNELLDAQVTVFRDTSCDHFVSE